MKITKKDVLEFSRAFDELIAISDSKLLTYILIKNRKILESEQKSLIEAGKIETAGYMGYLTDMKEIANKYGKKDKNGNVVMTNHNTSFELENAEDMKTVETLVKELNEKYKDILEHREKEFEKYQELLSEEVEYEFEKIPYDELPDVFPNENSKIAISILFELIER